jgi:glycerol kinase
MWRSREQIAAQWQMERRFEPRMARDEAADLMAHWRKAVDRVRGWEA